MQWQLVISIKNIFFYPHNWKHKKISKLSTLKYIILKKKNKYFNFLKELWGKKLKQRASGCGFNQFWPFFFTLQLTWFTPVIFMLCTCLYLTGTQQGGVWDDGGQIGGSKQNWWWQSSSQSHVQSAVLLCCSRGKLKCHINARQNHQPNSLKTWSQFWWWLYKKIYAYIHLSV